MTEHNDTPTQLPLGLARRGYTGVIQHSPRPGRLGAVGHRAREPADRARLRRGRQGRGAARRDRRARPDRGSRREHHHRGAPARSDGHHRRLRRPESEVAMEAPLMHLALVGTPNSGKTSLFNALTGSRQKVANYPGVTVERKEGSFVTPQGGRSRWSTCPAPIRCAAAARTRRSRATSCSAARPARPCPTSCCASPIPPICG